mgnify:CR=1 FL=1
MKKNKDVQIKAIIFDVGGVLALGKDLGQIRTGRTKGVHELIAKEFGISSDQWIDSLGKDYEGIITGDISEKEFLTLLSRTFDKKPSFVKNLFLKPYKFNFRPNIPLYSFALKLKKKGYKIAILSDQHYFSKQVLMSRKLINPFDPVIISCDVGMRKPNPKIYSLTLKKLGLKPQECVFIDNQEWNLVPARKFGIQTILFKSNKQLFKQLFKQLLILGVGV